MKSMIQLWQEFQHCTLISVVTHSHQQRTDRQCQSDDRAVLHVEISGIVVSEEVGIIQVEGTLTI